MSRKHVPPVWIKAYDGGAEFWPPYWDRSVLRRILASSVACDRFDGLLGGFGADVAQDVLEACLAMRGLWESAPKITSNNRDKAIRQIRGRVSDLLMAIQDSEDALRAYRALARSLPSMFPERPELLSNVTDEAAPISIVDVLNRFYASLREPGQWEGSPLTPAKPAHANAFRTFATQNLIRLLRTRTGVPMHSVIADLVNLIIDSAEHFIDPTHVAKLDPGEDESVL